MYFNLNLLLDLLAFCWTSPKSDLLVYILKPPHCFLSLLSSQGPKVSSKSVFCSSDNHLIIRGRFTHYLSEWSFAHIRNVMKEASELCFKSSKLYRMLFYISLMCNNDVLVGFQGKAPFSSSN